MILAQALVDKLSSSGNSAFRVLFNYMPVTNSNDLVRIRRGISSDGSVVPEFGVFKSSGGRMEFTPIDNFILELEERLLDRKILSYDFSSMYSENSFHIEINEHFKLINIVQGHFKDLCDLIFRQDKPSELKAGDFVLTYEHKERLFSYFEEVAVTSYIGLLNTKIIDSLRRDNSVKLYIVLQNYVLAYFNGPCVLNPIMDCERYAKTFKTTKLYEKIAPNVFSISQENSIALLTNREISEALGLNRFMRFEPRLLVHLIMGLLNPTRLYSASSYMYASDTGTIYTEAQLRVNGLNKSDFRPVPSLLVLVSNYRRELKTNNVELCFNIIKDCSLVI